MCLFAETGTSRHLIGILCGRPHLTYDGQFRRNSIKGEKQENSFSFRVFHRMEKLLQRAVEHVRYRYLLKTAIFLSCIFLFSFGKVDLRRKYTDSSLLLTLNSIFLNGYLPTVLATGN